MLKSNPQLYNKLVYVHNFLLDICTEGERNTEEEEQGKQGKQDITALAKILGNDINTSTPPPPPMTGTGGEPILLTLDMWRREQAHRATQEDTGGQAHRGAVKESLTDGEGNLLKLPVEGLSERARNNLKPVEGELLRIINNGIREGYFVAIDGVIKYNKYNISKVDVAILIHKIFQKLNVQLRDLGELWGIKGTEVSNLYCEWMGGQQSKKMLAKRDKQAEIIN